ncbi:MAG: hypothetical protein AMXMBFR34_36590 [Myxococcaceae bacterium]
MRPRRLDELKELVASPDFRSWWEGLVAARVALAETEAQREEALSSLTAMEFRAELSQKHAIDTLYRAGESEDQAAHLLAEAETLENRSFPGVAAFEEQRYRVSELWYRLGALETQLEHAKETKQSAAQILTLERQRQSAADEYEKETARKNRLWDEVERLWAKSAEVSLLRSEQQLQARKVRREAESLFALAEERKKRALGLRTGSEAAAAAVEAARARLEAARSAATERFGALAGTDFLFFRHPQDSRHAYAVALVEDTEHYNVEVRPLALYSVEHRRGVAFLEPARAQAPGAEEGDHRFEQYFLHGRKGEPRRTPV